jgi:acyl-coenzyme A synthetase/AMP-(fatty) acid ligase
VPVPDREAGEAIALFVVPSNGATGLQDAIRRSLPPHWTCASIELVEELPRTSSGKIARNELRARS